MPDKCYLFAVVKAEVGARFLGREREREGHGREGRIPDSSSPTTGIWYNAAMAHRNVVFAEGEFYHVFNRGTDKRDVFDHKKDMERFLLTLQLCNTAHLIRSVTDTTPTERERLRQETRLADMVAYCFNPNHFHTILRQNSEGGISSLMKKTMGGYTRYFNEKNHRSGALFQGQFKAKHIASNEYLLHVSAYVNLNNRVHGGSNPTTRMCLSSWEEYVGDPAERICDTAIVLDQFSTKEKYQKFSEEALKEILHRRYEVDDFEH